MNMNDKGWNEFWDDEPHEDDDDEDYNDMGSDVDANNDETFDNAAEWNEDEHEELIARDSILSQTIRNNNHNSRRENNSSSRARSSNQISSSNNPNSTTTNNSINNSRSSNGNAESSASIASILGSVRGGWNSVVGKEDNQPVDQSEWPATPSTSSGVTWQGMPSASDRLRLLQLQQQQLMIQKRLQFQQQEQQQTQLQQQQQQQQAQMHQRIQQQEAQQQIQQQHRQRQQLLMMERQLQQQQTERLNQPQLNRIPSPMQTNRQVLTVDELEKQLLKTRVSEDVPHSKMNSYSGPKRDQPDWSPFGGKDLFKSSDHPTHPHLDSGSREILSPQMSSLTIEQQQQIFLHQQQILKHQQQLQQVALLKQHQLQQLQEAQQRQVPKHPQCFTVEELERQMVADRSNSQNDVARKRDSDRSVQNQSPKPMQINLIRANLNPIKTTHERRDGDRQRVFDRHDRNNRDPRDQRDRRLGNHHRDNNTNEPAIIPPQVQLSVIEKASKLHSIKAMQSDEFLKDRMPTPGSGFTSDRHSKMSEEKSKHDGVLNRKDRDWLVRIQEKIQADYDDNLDQDYYYLLYFNRSSMQDEAVQKPCGPGVLDRRFIPRERLLYNSST